MTMPQATIGTGPERARTRLRPATLTVGLLATTVLLLVALHVIDSGYVRGDVQSLQTGDAWRSGGWLAQVVLLIASLVQDTLVQQTVLSLIAVGFAGVLVAALYNRLVSHGWLVFSAVIVLLSLGMHAGILYTLTASGRSIPVFMAVAALIPAIRMMEDAGDVQSAIGLGLLLPLLLLASPVTTPLILPLAIGAAIAGADSRRDPRAFVAMFLVSILPTLIVMLGIIGFLVQAHIDPMLALRPYITEFSDIHLRDPLHGLVVLVAFAPVLVVPIAYCFWPGLPERRHVLSAAAVVVLPIYLVMARESLVTAMTPVGPAVALLGAFVSWLAVVRLPMALRLLALLMLVLSAVLSWTLPGLWDAPEWKAALLSLPIPSEF